jgi:hypothetical protein
VRRGVTIEELLLIVNAVADVAATTRSTSTVFSISPGTGCGDSPTRFDLRG